GWSVKSMHRLILNSAAYRQSALSLPSPAETAAKLPAQIAAGLERDSDNQLYWHFPRKRLHAESIRDAMLAVSGQLNWEMYGEGVKPALPPNFSARHGWQESSPPQQVRRSAYIYAQRNLPY